MKLIKHEEAFLQQAARMWKQSVKSAKLTVRTAELAAASDSEELLQAENARP